MFFLNFIELFWFWRKANRTLSAWLSCSHRYWFRRCSIQFTLSVLFAESMQLWVWTYQYFSVLRRLFAAANLYLSVLLQNIHGVSLYHSALLQKFEFVPLCTSYFCRLFVPFCTSANYHCNEFAFYAQTPLRGKVQFKKPLYFPQINHPSLVPDSSVCKQWL